jgi:hypothetical protein
LAVKLQLIGLLALGLLACGPACADAPNKLGGLSAPAGFRACTPDDPVTTAEAGIAAKLGGQFLGCFQSNRVILAPKAPNVAPSPADYAFAIALPRDDYTLADLDELLETIKGQWKNFDPLSKEYKENYLARLNDLIKENGSTPSPTMLSIKPVLVSIDRAKGNYYTVTSIRTYAAELNGARVTFTRVDADAVVFRRSHLIRLSIQRNLTDPANVAQVQGELDEWARATARN